MAAPDTSKENWPNENLLFISLSLKGSNILPI